MKTLLTQSEMARASTERDTSYDGVFYVCVRTTGIFCRPSCPARKPRPENVEYLGTVQDALIAGFRACKRCRPIDPDGCEPPWVRRLVECVDAAPSVRLRDADLRAMDIDPASARRYFKRHFGMTFQAYHRARRMGLALTELRRGADPLAVGLGHGYESSSGFREAFARTFGEPPGRGREANSMVSRSLKTPIGPMVAAANDDGVCFLEFADRRSFDKQLATARRRLRSTVVPGTNEHVDLLESELKRYFAGELMAFEVPLVSPGTPFQRAVWDGLAAIPYGDRTSYGELAEQIGCAGGQRAVGRANGDNRIAIVLPCHRVVQKDGTLRGYGGGLWRKQFLLDLERGVLAKLGRGGGAVGRGAADTSSKRASATG